MSRSLSGRRKILNTTHKSPELPRAIIKKQAALSLIWAVPVVAAIVAGILIFQNVRKIGPAITIQFEDGSGLGANQTVIRYRGTRVGSVKSVELTRDMRLVEVHARLDRSAAGLAREGTIFWIVRPEVGAAGVHALETIVSGPYIEALPGNGNVQKKFMGASEAPVIKQSDSGTEFILRAPLVRSLGPNSPVYYRGLQVGEVQYLELGRDSTTVSIHVFLKPNFAPLVRTNTVWWNAGGINIDWHLLLRFTMTAENLRSIVTGGIAFATPNEPGPPAPPETIYVLHEKPEEEWLAWSPRMNITNATVSTPGTSPSFDFNDASQSQKQP
ncbi:MAG TPA: MlaD family protein [Verrucomicrobiae bacterium]|nr:MlaD family protein [Verrucomicrobiae bacterium]